MHYFTASLQKRGWKSKEVAERWGITAVRMSQIAAKPSQLHVDAVNGLPYRMSDSERKQRGEKVMADMAKLLGQE